MSLVPTPPAWRITSGADGTHQLTMDLGPRCTAHASTDYDRTGAFLWMSRLTEDDLCRLIQVLTDHVSRIHEREDRERAQEEATP